MALGFKAGLKRIMKKVFTSDKYFGLLAMVTTKDGKTFHTKVVKVDQGTDMVDEDGLESDNLIVEITVNREEYPVPKRKDKITVFDDDGYTYVVMSLVKSDQISFTLSCERHLLSKVRSSGT